MCSAASEGSVLPMDRFGRIVFSRPKMFERSPAPIIYDVSGLKLVKSEQSA
jgi:hypothetical protein